MADRFVLVFVRVRTTLTLVRQNAPRELLLELVLLEGLERRRAATQGVVAGDPVEYVNAAVVQQGRLRDCPLRRAGAAVAAFERFSGHFLNRFEAVAFGALVFVKRHDRLLSH